MKKNNIMSPPRDENLGATQNSKIIHASPEKIYKAFTDPDALAVWFAPGEMTAQVHRFDLRVGGGYEMSLFYPQTGQHTQGKTTEKEDRYAARFVELIPSKRIVQAIRFDTDDPGFSGEMIMEVVLAGVNNGTHVTITFRNIPSGIRPEDNEKGTALTLDKLAQYVLT